MSASIGIAVFVKTSALSPVKTRLASAIGQAAALEIFRASVSCVRASVSLASQRCSLQPYWAVAEAQGVSAWGDWPVLVQAQGDLGARMADIYRQLRLRHRGAVLLGADAPALTPWLIADACAALEATPSRVIAPTVDGGFILFGSNQDLHDADWSAVPYGAPDTALRFIAAIGAAVPVTPLALQQDLDTIEDLRQLRLHPPIDPTDAQRHFWSRIPDWLARARV